ncbi:DNA polymerase III subunit gamma/tau [Comamonadaceae bacterium OH2545_COT-014]|nr:DNA polymerase III subunit gamma/tau [Comamonadaceae bacterium OH2545_COT-014]
MSYLVLARKYRPRNFAEMVGQEHVVQALGNALTQQRLHHAYLFTGTRGVGKTTVSRILAKSLNCTGPDGSGGITATPCGQCAACTEIDAGRFVDYTELDAASNRGVDEVQSLLEQAVYKPVQGRFKVFMIDEVHMLTNTAFNAMLKTLEEPPEYLKFVLATTDPQKVPVTVLSRCLQFNLRPMAPETVLAHLAHVLATEQVPAEPGALRLLARAARGSMRDALSLTDQAIAFGSGQLTEASVRQMLGSVDRSVVFRLLEALAEGNGRAVVELAEQLRNHGLSAATTLEDMATVLQRMAVYQAVPDMPVDAADPDAQDIACLAARLPADETQLLYSLCLHGRAELGLAPDEYTGLTMALLRLLPFKAPPGDVTEKKTLKKAEAPAAPGAEAAAAASTAATLTPAEALDKADAASAATVTVPPAFTSTSHPQPAPADTTQPLAAHGPSALASSKAVPAADAAETSRASSPEPAAAAPAVQEPRQAPARPPAAPREPASVSATGQPGEHQPQAAAAPMPPAAKQETASPPSSPSSWAPLPPEPLAAASTAPDDDAGWASAVMADEAQDVAALNEPPPWLDEAPPDDEVLPVAVPPRRPHPPVQPLPVRLAAPQEASSLMVEKPFQAVGTAQNASELIAIPVHEVADQAAPAPTRVDGGPVMAPTADGDFWHALVQDLVAREAITALTRELALQAQLVAREGTHWRLRVQNTTLAQSSVAAERLQAALHAAGHTVQLTVEAGPVGDNPSRRNAIRANHRLKAAEALLLADPFVQEMVRDFGATVVAGSLKAL